MSTSFKTMFAAAVVAAGVGVAGGASAESVRFMTGPQGGVWIPLGGALKDMFEKGIPGTSVQALPGAGMDRPILCDPSPSSVISCLEMAAVPGSLTSIKHCPGSLQPAGSCGCFVQGLGRLGGGPRQLVLTVPLLSR